MGTEIGKWARWAAIGLALFSGLAALGLLILPLILVLLMVLFETTARGVLVLLGLLVNWLRDFVPGSGGSLPPFQAVVFHPLEVALGSLLRAMPCLAGLMLILLRRSSGRWWWWILMLWSLAAAIGGRPVATLLLPGLVIAAIFALRSAAIRGR